MGFAVIYSMGITPLNGEVIRIKLSLDPENNNEKYAVDFFESGTYLEPEVSNVMIRAIRRGDFVVDVGANAGVFTVLMAKLVGPEGLVLAIEPDEYNLSVLRTNIRLNELDNVRIVHQPLWHSEEELAFYSCCDSTGSGAVWDVKLWPPNKKTRAANVVPRKFMSSTLDKEISQVGRECSFIKVDTEGADESILRGLGARRPAFIVAEFNVFGAAQFGHDNATFRAFMRGLGYDCFLIFDDGRLPAMVPPASEITNGFNGFIICNVLFSTLEQVGRAWPKVTNIKDGTVPV